MNKTSRLSFRIEKKTSESIDLLIEDNPDIRDRTDFGTKSIIFYLENLKKNKDDMVLIIEALLSMTKPLNLEKDPDVKELKKLHKKYLTELNFK